MWEQAQTSDSVTRFKDVQLLEKLVYYLLRDKNAKLLSLGGENRTDPDLKCREALDLLLPFEVSL